MIPLGNNLAIALHASFGFAEAMLWTRQIYTFSNVDWPRVIVFGWFVFCLGWFVWMLRDAGKTYSPETLASWTSDLRFTWKWVWGALLLLLLHFLCVLIPGAEGGAAIGIVFAWVVALIAIGLALLGAHRYQRAQFLIPAIVGSFPVAVFFVRLWILLQP